jgi:glycosyltransferase involved in cell wall biosynthesis
VIPVASVIVPTCRRADLLVRCLAALVEQQFGGEPFEVIVADDAGVRRTAEVALRFMAAGPPSVRYLAVGPRHGPAAARNAGARAARAAVLAFTDDDCLPARTWLREGLAALRRRPAAAGARARRRRGDV